MLVGRHGFHHVGQNILIAHERQVFGRSYPQFFVLVVEQLARPFTRARIPFLSQAEQQLEHGLAVHVGEIAQFIRHYHFDAERPPLTVILPPHDPILKPGEHLTGRGGHLPSKLVALCLLLAAGPYRDGRWARP